MSNGKHSSSEKHINESKNKKSSKMDSSYKKQGNSKKRLKIVLLIFLLIIVIAIIIFFIYRYFYCSKKLPTYNGNNFEEKNMEVCYEPTEKAETKDTLTVEGAEYLEITGLYINSDNPKLSTVAAKLKNNSDKSYKNVSLRITLFDKDNKSITSLDYKVDKIEANGEASTFAAVKQDLSNCVNYSIALKKN